MKVINNIIAEGVFALPTIFEKKKKSNLGKNCYDTLMENKITLGTFSFSNAVFNKKFLK